MKSWAALLAVIALVPAGSLLAGTDAAPTSAASIRRALGPALEQKDPAKATELLSTLADQGFALSKPTRARFAEFVPADRMADLEERFEANARPLQASSVRHTLPEALMLVEGIAHDAASGTTFFATVAGRALWALKGDRLDAVPLPPETGSLFGLAIDAKRRMLWIASGTADPTPKPETAFRGLIGYDLDGKSQPRLVAMPAGFSPADIAILRDGSVILADGTGGGLFRCAAPCTQIDPFVASTQLKGPQGIAQSRDEKALIVADYGTGLWRVPLSEPARMTAITADKPVMIDGIDGLVAHGDRLIAIQNGTQPRRILSLLLSRDEKRVSDLTVLERVPAESGEPTLGTMIGDSFVYVADAQWEVWDKGGIPRTGSKPRPTVIRALPIE
jgi:hypothetical protein